MTTPQVLAVSILLITVLAVYGYPFIAKLKLPSISQPESKSNALLDEMADVMSIRDSHKDKETIEACNVLLHCLLKVTQ